MNLKKLNVKELTIDEKKNCVGGNPLLPIAVAVFLALMKHAHDKGH